MRRVATALLLTLFFLLASCGRTDEPESATADSESAQGETDGGGEGADEPPATEPPTTEPPATDPPTTTTTTTAPPVLATIEPVGRGPYEVGVATVVATDESRERPLTVDIWFPIDNSIAIDASFHRYTFVTGDYYESPEAFTADASLLATDGPFPLVVYSHGSGGTRYIHSDYTETLASHGYIVASADHTGNTAVERVLDTADEPEVISINRPLDVSTVIDAMTDPENPATSAFVAAVDAERIAVTGHSFGGYTTYAMVSGFSNEVGTVEPDPRVDAIIPLAPASRAFSDEQFASISVPSLVIVGTNDQTTPVDPNVTRPWELSASSPHYRLELVDAQHNTFTDICAYAETLPELENVTEVVLETINSQAVEGCSPGDMEIDRAQDLTNTFAVAFLESVFEDGEMISAEEFEIPEDVTYQTK